MYGRSKIGGMMIIATLALAATAAESSAQTNKPGKTKFNYDACMAQKTKVGLPPARAAKVCQRIMNSR
jgi:hypothetical protein